MGKDRRSLLAAALAVAVCLGSPAHAGPGAALRARAVKRFEQGEAYFLAGAFDKAAAEYQAAYDLVPKAGLLFNIALCRENLGDAAGAIDFYRKYLASDPHGNRSVEARARLIALEEKLAAEVRRADEERQAREAERERRARAMRAAAAARERQRRAERDRPRLLPGLLVLGGAAGAGAVGLAYQLKARSIRDELDRELVNGTPPLDSRDPRFDQGRSAALRSSIAYGVAGAAGAVGAFLTVRALLARRPARAAVQVHPIERGAGAALEVTW